jgi:ABC-type uncharacterized transport system permease subunit
MIWLVEHLNHYIELSKNENPIILLGAAALSVLLACIIFTELRSAIYDVIKWLARKATTVAELSWQSVAVVVVLLGVSTGIYLSLVNFAPAAPPAPTPSVNPSVTPQAPTDRCPAPCILRGKKSKE